MFTEAPDDEPAPDRLLRLACLNYTADDPENWIAAAALRVADPSLPNANVSVAAVCGDYKAMERHLAADPGSASRPDGPYGWSPLMYLTYNRMRIEFDHVLECAGLLLDAGADPNDGRCFGGEPTPFTVLTGVFGGGEQNPPPHHISILLAHALLTRGADPNDEQTLYNRMFTLDDDFLTVLFKYGLRNELPDLLEWAVTHDQRARVDLLATHGVDVLSPIAGDKTPIDLALANGLHEMSELLRRLGATAAPLNPVEAFISAALSGDADAVHNTPADVIASAREQRPALVVWAASQGRVNVVELLVANGFDVNAYGRGDVPVEQEWQTALHTAIEHGHTRLVHRLPRLGADVSLRDKRFNGTAFDWCDHFGRPDLKAHLAG